ncbi:tyrosine-protein phosphatase [Caenibius sp. WL]|uniref:tyrosine-protein phosphatase n=1 Tax=Caenibius sp. WL TaxID=2872646 RepID=UPI001C99D9C8|nr:tyrosine-protein phosphatase [Caenibius sp. WL]QZP07538.1 tyrosine-protein phosphatase [Caenibius sp. WL]
MVTPATAAVSPCPASASAAEAESPFLTAEVAQIDGRPVVSWMTRGASHVEIAAGSEMENGRREALGRGGKAGQIVLPPSKGNQRTFFRLTPDCGQSLIVADRDVSRTRLPNLRDLGGYRTAGGAWVRMGMIYRSGELARLAPSDIKALERLHLTTVVDLRHEQERKDAPGELLAGARYVVADVFADPPGDLGNIQELIDSGRGDEVLLRLNRAMVSSPSALRAYSALFHLLAQDTDGAALFYCTAGKDRTGWAAAVLLTLLGVPKETVYRDYLLSNGYRSKEIAAGIGKHGAAFVPLERVAPEYLDAAFDEVDRRYGSFDNYLREGLGLDAKALAKLRDKFLQSGPA